MMESIEKLDDWIGELGHWIIEHASRHLLIKRHFLIDLRNMDTKHARIEAQINGETLHPSQGITMPFDSNDRDKKNTLIRGKDFLSFCSGRR
jgi:hypothetical protein